MRRVWMLSVMAAATAAPTAGHCQATAAADRPLWKADWTVTANPVFGNEFDAPWGDTVIDEAEYKVGATWKRHIASGAEVIISGTAAVNPNQFDDDDRASSLALQAEIRRSYATDLLDERGVAWPSQDAITPFARYRLSNSYTNEFDASKGVSHTATGGVTFQDMRTYVCVSRTDYNPVREGSPRCRDGRLWSLTPSISKVVSSNDDDELFSSALEAVFSTPIYRHVDWTVTVKAEGQFNVFDSQLGSDGQERQDQRFTLTVNLDVTRPLDRVLPLPDGFSVQLGVRYSRNWSNLDGKDFERRYFAPSISWKRPF